MSQLFVVLRTRGSRWNYTRTLEEQDLWQTHAAFMNGLVHEGFVLLGGPLEGTPDVMLLIRASHVEHIMYRLADNPWSRNGLPSLMCIPGTSASAHYPTRAMSQQVRSAGILFSLSCEEPARTRTSPATPPSPAPKFCDSLPALCAKLSFSACHVPQFYFRAGGKSRV
jgi:hypothetical protein